VSELDDLRREYAEVTIGRELADLLGRVVRSTAPTYPPAGYSDAGVWNREAIEDAMQDWIATRLLGRGDLARMLGAATTVSKLRAMLTTSFGQFLTNRRQRTSATNLFQRVVRILRGDARFTAVGRSRSSSTQRWVVAGAAADGDGADQVLDRLLKAAASKSDDELGVIRYGPYSLKSSPIMRNPELADFLVFLVEQADGALSAAELFQVLRHRFNLAELGQVELDSGMKDTGQVVAEAVETTVLAESVLARLGRDKALLIRFLHAADGNSARAAEEAGVAESNIAAVADEVMALIAEYAETLDEALAVHRRLAESLFIEEEDQ
jgi:hypothetical protein